MHLNVIAAYRSAGDWRLDGFWADIIALWPNAIRFVQMNVLMNVNLSKELEPQLNFFPLTLYKVTNILIILFTMTLN